MTRLNKATLALAASLMAIGALGQSGFTQDSESVTVADDLFGPEDVKLEFNGFDPDPKAKLLYTGATLEIGTNFSVTYAFHNASLAERASVDDVMWGVWRPEPVATDDPATTTVNETCYSLTELKFRQLDKEVTIERNGDDSGAIGSSSVTYDFEIGMSAVDANAATLTYTDSDIGGLSPATWTKSEERTCDHDGDGATDEITISHYPASAATRKIVLRVPDLNAKGLREPDTYFPGDPGVSVAVSTMIERGTNVGTRIRESIIDGTMCGTTTVAKTGTGPCVVVDSASVVSLTADGGSGGAISLSPSDMRATLVKADGKALDPQRAMLATVTVGVGEGPLNAEGDVASVDDGLSGTVAVTVSSDSFREGDVVYIDANGNKKVDGREAFDMDLGEGVARDTVPLEEKAYDVYYVPNGKDAMSHRTKFSTSAATEFSATNNKVRTAKAVDAMLNLNGVSEEGSRAYAIAPVNSSDKSNVRVTCETAGKNGCKVFLDCYDTDGMGTFGPDDGIGIGPKSTAHWTQEDIAMALGMMEGESWAGRLACEVLSTADISVQVLTRSGDVLVNNTYVAD